MTISRRPDRFRQCVLVSGLLAGSLLMAWQAANAASLCDDPDTSIPVDACIDHEGGPGFLDLGDADTPWRWIGVLAKDADTSCPQPTHWNATPLFEIEGKATPRGLRRYCVFEAADWNEPRLREMARLGRDPRIEALDPDVMAVTTMGRHDSLKKLVWRPYHDHFLQQVKVAPSAPPAEQRVRLAVIDTQATSLTPFLDTPSLSLHGMSLIQMARDIACLDAQGCGVRVTSEIALAYRRCPQAGGIEICYTPANGGHMTTPSELAAAIHRQVADWRSSTDAGLVINLSVGYDPRFDERRGRVRSGSAALIDSLRVASCMGAIAVAAAGNPVSGPEPSTGALMPGRLEEEPAPDAQACADLVGPAIASGTSFPGSQDAYRPLLYAVGAIAADDSPVQDRRQGEPRLVAFGDHAVGEASGLPTETQTGTSAAALVVSATAAAAWTYDVGARSDEVMDAIYRSGRSLSTASAPRLASFCLGNSPCPDVARVYSCDAVRKICSDASSCGGMATCPPDAAVENPRLPAEDIAALYEDSSATEVDLIRLREETVEPACGAGYRILHKDSRAVADPCPHRQFYGLQATPAVTGQPSGQTCEDCNTIFDSPGTLYIQIGPRLLGELRRGTLVCGDTAYRLPVSLTAGELLKVVNVPEGCMTTGAELAFRVENFASADGQVSAVGPLLLILPDIEVDGGKD